MNEDFVKMLKEVGYDYLKKNNFDLYCKLLKFEFDEKVEKLKKESFTEKFKFLYWVKDFVWEGDVSYYEVESICESFLIEYLNIFKGVEYTNNFLKNNLQSFNQHLRGDSDYHRYFNCSSFFLGVCGVNCSYSKSYNYEFDLDNIKVILKEKFNI